ncbi:MAG: hypothetical protein QM778_17480 [Myxococcales bacterium]
MSRLATLCALAILVLHAPVQAQGRSEAAWCSEEPCLPPKYDASRTLNNHAFVPFQTLPFPFVTTRVTGQTGMGIVNLKSIPVANVGVVTTNDAKLVSFTQSFLADVQLVKWLGLSGGFAVGNAVGINSSGAFNLGINYAVGGTLGVNFRLAQGKKWYLSLRGDGVWQRAEAVLPAALAQSATDENGTITFAISSLTQGGNVANGVGNLMFAVAPHRMFGVFANTGFRYQHVSVGGQKGDDGNLLFGLGSQLRLNSVGAPIVFTLGGSIQVRTNQSERVFFPTIGSQGSTTGYVEGGILYSDPKFVDVGVQTTWSVATNDNRKQAVLVINHFW